MLAARPGDHGGKDARRDYIRFVEAGLTDPPPPPFREAIGGWILGSERFVARLRSQAGPVLSNPPDPRGTTARRSGPETYLRRGGRILRPGSLVVVASS